MREDSGESATNRRRIRELADTLLVADVFQKSPVISKLLKYLVEMTEKGRAVKSYTIAIDGLGKSDPNLADADTYARVAVARLRKAIAAYYAANPSDDQIYIDSGTYEVRWRIAEKTDPTHAPPVRPLDRLGLRRVRFGASTYLAVLMTVAAISLIGMSWRSSQKQAATWAALDLPTLFVESPQSDSRSAEAQRRLLIIALGSYAGARIIEDPKVSTDYRVSLFMETDRAAPRQFLSLKDNHTGRVIWSASYRVDSPNAAERVSIEAAAAIASPSGSINSYARRLPYDVQTPYGCWLKFTEGVQTYNTIGDSALIKCARDWYRASGDRPLAAFLYGWTLTDQSVLQLLPANREATLRESLDVLNRASALNPDWPLLRIAQMRAYSFQGDRQRTLEAARSAISSSSRNRVVVGMAASGMALWNDPQGAEILQSLQESGSFQHPWEHTGLFIAAMMQDDVVEASKHQKQLDAYETGQPFLLLLKAALAARTNRQEEVRSTLARLDANQWIGTSDPRQMIDRLPIAPEVKARLLDWISRTASADP